jgi:RNA polymerase sigma-70 factor, ECF subfamily
MNTFQRTVSQEAIETEWSEIQAAQANPALFRPLYNRYFEPIFHFIYKRTLDESLTADLSSQVFLKALQQLAGYTFRGVPFSAWLFRIASNEVAQYYRHSNKRRVVALEDSRIKSMLDELDDSDNRERYQVAMIAALDDLREQDLQIIEMRFFEQRPFKEIAGMLDITESNAKVRTYRVLERIKKIMSRQLGENL